MKKFFFIVVAIILLLSCFFLFWLPEKYTVPVIMFHQVEKIDNREPNWVSPENFEFQMAFLKKNGFKVISLDQLVEAIKAGKKLSRKSVVLTFDDGYENNYTNAYPILKKYGYTATIFLISDLIDTKGYVTSKEVEEMYAGGISFGSHSRRHLYLPNATRDQQVDEIVNSKKILEEKFHFTVMYFAYPSGGFSEDVKSIAESAGYKGACTTNRGYDRYNKDLFEIKRIKFSDRDVRLDYLWAKLSGYYNVFRKLKKSH